MFARVKTACVRGVNGVVTDVEVYIGNGIPSFEIIGKAECSVKESKERIKAVLKNCGYDAVTRKIIVNLHPADVVKRGSHFDLPIAIGVLAASEQLWTNNIEKIFENTVFFGELSLDGSLKKVKGVLAMAEGMAEAGVRRIIVPVENVAEAEIVDDVEVLGFENLNDVIGFISSNMSDKSFCKRSKLEIRKSNAFGDLADIKGHEEAKRVMEIAASGGHSMLLVGSPGAGKSMLAKRMSSILPEMTPKENYEVAKIKSIVGENISLAEDRPFRMLHHTCTRAAMLGGGRDLVPGEITLAHNGVLFLDELAEFSHSVLDGLRQPMEDGFIVLSRASGSVCYPSNFMLIAASNPCLCGRLLEGKDKCKCTPYQRENYLHRISGPLLDRIDLKVNVFSMKYDVLAGKTCEDNSDMTSSAVKARVTKCRELQLKRYRDEEIEYNAQLQYKMLNKYCVLEDDAEQLLKQVINTAEHSGRYYTRVLKIARTIADMEMVRDMECQAREGFTEQDLYESKVKIQHVAEAMRYKVSNTLV